MTPLGTILPNPVTLAQADREADRQKRRDVEQGRALFAGAMETCEQMERRWYYAPGRWATVHHGRVRCFERRKDGDYAISPTDYQKGRATP